ncbi:MAG TPA: hypothetical protein VGQ39_05180 [Pyrinomonadaceae bacterium]|nr:hypothetical protein [Pyrinomonadaceae bacterium]
MPVDTPRKGQSRKVKLSKNIRQKKAKGLRREVSSEFEVVCSWCGALIRSSSQADSEQMCLICHARMLNEYFQNLRKRSDGKRETSRAASE